MTKVASRETNKSLKSCFRNKRVDAVPPSETTRLLESLLDGQKRRKKDQAGRAIKRSKVQKPVTKTTPKPDEIQNSRWSGMANTVLVSKSRNNQSTNVFSGAKSLPGIPKSAKKGISLVDKAKNRKQSRSSLTGSNQNVESLLGKTSIATIDQSLEGSNQNSESLTGKSLISTIDHPKITDGHEKADSTPNTLNNHTSSLATLEENDPRETKHEEELSLFATKPLCLSLPNKPQFRKRRLVAAHHDGSMFPEGNSLEPTVATDPSKMEGDLPSSSVSTKASKAVLAPKSPFEPTIIKRPQDALCLESSLRGRPDRDKENNGKKDSAKPRSKVDNSNFVRQNLRNGAGSCLGAKRKKAWKRSLSVNQHGKEDSTANNKNHDNDTKDAAKPKYKGSRKSICHEGVDPLDDYLDGTLHQETKKTKASADIPKCVRHQLPCKLLKVKKNSTGNKGRPFYVCSMPRGEQCSHFKWADDTVEAAKRALQKNSSYSGFVGRQVAAYADRFRSLTVPELHAICKQRNLSTQGKKQQLLTRLSIWVRDEMVTSQSKEESAIEMELGKDDQVSSATSDDSASCSSEELGILPHMDEQTSNFTDVTNKDEDDSSCSSEELEIEQSSDARSEHDIIDDGVEVNCPLYGSLKRHFGYSAFHEGQDWAIQRCLNKQKTLLVAPTGFGKSLCYSLAAALMEGVCIVVSPLVSLIQDQLRELPPSIPAATLSGSLPAARVAAIVDDVVRMRIKILFVSPERLASPSFQRLFQMRWNPTNRKNERRFPDVSLLCIDEAHCMSQWGHNFRPSYLRLRSLIDTILPHSLLAITATAGTQVIHDICQTLDINRCKSCYATHCSCGVWIMKSNRDNISVEATIAPSADERLSMLLRLLTPCSSKGKSGRPSKDVQDGCLAHGSVIVYVWRKRDAEVIAERINAAEGVKGGVVCYHGGMDTNARSKAQSKFMRGKARICVATVAFGLGVNKRDVVGIVHMYLPSSPENYLQEIGRAGRDGRDARAIALVLEDEVLVRHSQAYSQMVSKSQVQRILEYLQSSIETVFQMEGFNDHPQHGFIRVAIPLTEVALATDCQAETVETLFSLIEQRNSRRLLLTVEGSSADQVVVSLKRRDIDKLASREDVARCIKRCGVCIYSRSTGVVTAEKSEENDVDTLRTRQSEFLAYSFGSYRFSVSECSNLLGATAEPRHVFAALRRLQNEGEIELSFDRSTKGKSILLKVQVDGAERIRRESDNEIISCLVEDIFQRSMATVEASSNKVLDINFMLNQVSQATAENRNSHDSQSPQQRSVLELFQTLTTSYFEAGARHDDIFPEKLTLPNFSACPMESELLIDCRKLLMDLGSKQWKKRFLKLGDPSTTDYTALAISKFFHGVDTIRAPFADFREHQLFGKLKGTKFADLLQKVHHIVSAS